MDFNFSDTPKPTKQDILEGNIQTQTPNNETATPYLIHLTNNYFNQNLTEHRLNPKTHVRLNRLR